jgi:hypothetical protein
MPEGDVGARGIELDGAHPKDLLDRRAPADVLARVILESSGEAPLVVGVLGLWGTGKTEFMRYIRDAIERRVRAADGVGAGALIAQRKYNAWHHVDSEPVSSIIGTVLDDLRVPSDASNPKAAAERQRQVLNMMSVAQEAARSSRRADLENRRREVGASLEKTREQRAEWSDPTAQGYLHEVAKRLDEKADTEVRRLQLLARIERSAAQIALPEPATAAEQFEVFGDRRLRRALPLTVPFTSSLATFTSFLLVSAALGVVAALVWIGALAATIPPVRYLGAGGLFALSLVLGVQFAFLCRRRTLRTIVAVSEDLGGFETIVIELRSLDDHIRELDTKSQALDEQLATLPSTTTVETLGEYISSELSQHGFEASLGLVPRLRADLKLLSEKALAGEVDLQQIVLYVDDLDRCSPKRVSEILTVVHTLLDFPIFTTVLAADIRWLTQSLQLEHVGLFGLGDDRLASPIDYVQKIFAFTYQLEPLRQEGVEHLLDAVQYITTEQREFTLTLAPLIGATPRSVKRLCNEFYLCQQLDPKVDRFIVLMLLAIAHGATPIAKAIFDELERSTGSAPIEVAVTTIDSLPGVAGSATWARLQQAWEAANACLATAGRRYAVEQYQAALPIVRSVALLHRDA